MVLESEGTRWRIGSAREPDFRRPQPRRRQRRAQGTHLHQITRRNCNYDGKVENERVSLKATAPCWFEQRGPVHLRGIAAGWLRVSAT